MLRVFLLVAISMILSSCETIQPPTAPLKSGWVCEQKSANSIYSCKGYKGIYTGEVKQRTLSNGVPIPFGDDFYQIPLEDSNKYFEPHGKGNFKRLDGPDYLIEGSFLNNTLKRGVLNYNTSLGPQVYAGSFADKSNWVEFPIFNRGKLSLNANSYQQILNGDWYHTADDLYLKSGEKVWITAENEFVGIGIRFTKSPHGALVQSIIPGVGPSNISSGDIILGSYAPSSISFEELDLNEISEIIKGPKNSKISLRVIDKESVEKSAQIDSEELKNQVQKQISQGKSQTQIQADLKNKYRWDKNDERIVSITRKLIKIPGCEINLEGKWDSNGIYGSPIKFKHPNATIKANFRKGQPSNGKIIIDTKTAKNIVNRTVTKISKDNLNRESKEENINTLFIATSDFKTNSKIFNDDIQNLPPNFSYGGIFDINQEDNAILQAKLTWEDPGNCSSSPIISDKNIFLNASDKRYIVNQTPLTIYGAENLDFEPLYVPPEDWDKEYTEDSQILLVEMIDKDADRSIVREETIRSTYRVGYQEVYNPKYDEALLNVQRARDKLYSAELEKARRNTECGKADSFGKALLCAVIDNAGVSSAESKLEQAISNLNSTSRTLQKPIMEPYVFKKNHIEATKKSTIKVTLIDSKSKRIQQQIINSSDSKKTIIIDRELPQTDPKLNSHKRGTMTEKDLDSWMDQTPLPNYKRISELIKYVTNEGVNKDFRKGLIELTTNKEKSKNKNKTIQTARSIKDKSIYDYGNSVVIIKDLKGGSGAGFYIKDQMIMTNAHVVDGKKYLTIENEDGKSFIGEVLMTDLDSDLAVLSVKESSKALQIKPGCSVRRGQDILTVGHPEGYNYTMTKGIVSNIRTKRLKAGGSYKRVIQIDANITFGSSGGPLIDEDGYVIGVNTFGDSSAEFLDFSIHCDEIEEFIEKYVP